MGKKKINTKLAITIIVVFIITVVIFIWKYEDIRYGISSRNNQQNIVSQTENNQEKSIKEQNIPEAIEYPTIAIESGVSLEEIIRQAIFKKFPNWKAKNYSVETTVETNERNHAIGRFVYDDYNTTRDGERHHNSAEGIWFAAKSDDAWTLVTTSYTGYWGSCQDFKKYKFPLNMIPDCWDTEKNILIDTSNPQRFYINGFTKKDKQELVQAFINYAKNGDIDGSGHWKDWLNKDLYVKVNKNTTNYLRGSILIGESENRSAPEFFATKQSGKWIIVYDGQDIPPCNNIEQYNFPHEVLNRCYDTSNKKEKEIL